MDPEKRYRFFEWLVSDIRANIAEMRANAEGMRAAGAGQRADEWLETIAVLERALERELALNNSEN